MSNNSPLPPIEGDEFIRWKEAFIILAQKELTSNMLQAIAIQNIRDEIQWLQNLLKLSVKNRQK